MRMDHYPRNRRKAETATRYPRVNKLQRLIRNHAACISYAKKNARLHDKNQFENNYEHRGARICSY